MKKRHVLIALCVALGLAYASGKRIADISETPSSKRPWSPVITAEYSNHLTSAGNSILDIFGENK